MDYDSILEAIDSKDFFKGRELFTTYRSILAESEGIVIEATLAHAFNRIQSSKDKIDCLLGTPGAVDPVTTRRLLKTQHANYVRLYQYKDAHKTLLTLLEDHHSQLTQEEITDFQNSLAIWGSLSHVPAQVLTRRDHSVLDLSIDKVGLRNISVHNIYDRFDFIFDTGANISTIAESVAERLGMTIIEERIEVDSITGIKSLAKLAFAPELHLGDIKVNNAIFLVFPDSALVIPQLDYQIQGIIGFPVIEAMKEVRISRENELIVPSVLTQYRHQNMALDFFMPIIQIDNDPYKLDTGAQQTMLYHSYYEKHKDQVVGLEQKSLNIGGAGGSLAKQVYQITFTPTVDGMVVRVPSVALFADQPSENGEALFGNIGQDMIKQFRMTILNFESMFVHFVN